MTRIYEGICTGAKRQKFLDSGFGLMTALCYPDADLERLRRTLDFVLWLFAVSTFRIFFLLKHLLNGYSVRRYGG